MADSAGGREAEIEAVARALWDYHGHPRSPERPSDPIEAFGTEAHFILDRLDALAVRSPQSEDHEAGMKAMGVLMRDYDRNGGYHPTVKQLADAYRDAARSPQSEDHD